MAECWRVIVLVSLWGETMKLERVSSSSRFSIFPYFLLLLLCGLVSAGGGGGGSGWCPSVVDARVFVPCANVAQSSVCPALVPGSFCACNDMDMAQCALQLVSATTRVQDIDGYPGVGVFDCTCRRPILCRREAPLEHVLEPCEDPEHGIVSHTNPSLSEDTCIDALNGEGESLKNGRRNRQGKDDDDDCDDNVFYDAPSDAALDGMDRVAVCKCNRQGNCRVRYVAHKTYLLNDKWIAGFPAMSLYHGPSTFDCLCNGTARGHAAHPPHPPHPSTPSTPSPSPSSSSSPSPSMSLPQQNNSGCQGGGGGGGGGAPWWYTWNTLIAEQQDQPPSLSHHLDEEDVPRGWRMGILTLMVFFLLLVLIAIFILVSLGVLPVIGGRGIRSRTFSK